MLSAILVPMDDSEPAEQALAHALDSHPNADITVLTVVGVPSMTMGEAAGLSLADDLEAAAAELAEPIFEHAREVAAKRDREIETVVAVGHPARAIIDRAEAYDGVVLGRHGADWRRAPRQFLLGNIAETVARRAPVPVTVVG